MTHREVFGGSEAARQQDPNISVYIVSMYALTLKDELFHICQSLFVI